MRYVARSGVGDRKLEHASHRIDRDDKKRDPDGNPVETLVVVNNRVIVEFGDEREST